MSTFRAVLAASALAVAGFFPAAAQTPAEPEPAERSMFVERVDVDVVNVTAVVTDDRGNPVLGLTREDFELLEDGVPVEITNFYAETAAELLEAQLARGEAAARGEAPPKGSEFIQERQLNLVVYVDNFNMRPENRRRVLPEVLEFVQTRVARGDTVMVASYGTSLSIDQPFTRELYPLEEAIRASERRTAARTQDDLHRREVLQHIRRATEEGRQREAYQYLRSYVQSTTVHLRRSMEALGSVVRSLAGLPGRKAILYLSDGLPKRPGEDLYQVFADAFAVSGMQMPRAGPLDEPIDPSVEMLQEDQSHLFSSVIQEANAGQVTFYTIDARGGAGASSLPADQPDLTIGNAGTVALDQLRTQTFQEPLLDLAVATGGTAVLNAFRIRESLEDVHSDLESYYSLAFRSRHGGDGKYHRIEVRTKRPGLRVRHRAGYFDKPEVVRVADRTFSSLLLGLGKNPLGVELEFGPAERKGLRRYHLPVLVRVPLAQVTLLPNGAAHEGRLRFYVAVRDEEGGLSEVMDFEYPVVVPAAELERARGRELGFLRTLEVRPGVADVAVGVWDELSGADSYVLKTARLRQGGRAEGR